MDEKKGQEAIEFLEGLVERYRHGDNEPVFLILVGGDDDKPVTAFNLQPADQGLELMGGVAGFVQEFYDNANEWLGLDKKDGPAFDHPALKQCAAKKPPGWKSVEENPLRRAWVRPKDRMQVMASVNRERDGRFWMHVSFSRPQRMPSYDDMVYVKRHWIGEDQKAIMIGPPREEHVNVHEFCLHWWCCVDPIGDGLPDFRHHGEI